MKHGSLFSGIGGFDLGFERAGIETIWQVEIDEYCRKVLARHFPHAQRFSDIRECGTHNLQPVDVLSGGFPCQDISNAGKRAGIDGERSGLWREMHRVIRELRPSYVVVENVAALLGRGMERVLGDLAACGYDAEWQSIRASDVGAPHRRERIWIVAYPRGEQHQGSCIENCGPSAEVLLADTESNLRGASRDDGPGPLDASDSLLAYAGHRQQAARRKIRQRNAERPELESMGATVPDAKIFSKWTGLCESEQTGQRFGRFSDCDWWAVEPDVGRVAHGIPARVDRLRGLGNAIVPQIAEWIGKRLMAQGQPEKESGR